MKFVSSISGLPISAASAAYAPTNGADVSAVASAYAESAASGKLDSTASSQFITSTDGLATTEYVDSSVSSKLDTTAFSTVSSNFLTSETVTATAGDGVYITSINGLGLSGQGGGGGGVVTATGSASATSGFWPVTTAYLVSSINGSALLPYGYSSISANSANWNSTRTTVLNNSANWTSVYDTVYSNSASWTGSTGGGSVTSPSGTIFVNGSSIEGTNSAVLTAAGEGFETVIYPQDTHIGPQMTRLVGGSVPGTGATLMIPLEQAAYANCQVILSGTGENGWASASGTIPMGTLTASVPLEGITGEIFASANQWFNLSNGGLLTAKKDGGILVTGIGELAWKSAVDNVTNTVSANSATWGQGGVVTSTGSSTYWSAGNEYTVVNSINGSSLGAVTSYSANSAYQAVYDQSGRRLDYLPDKAKVSAIASSYAESAVSSKADSSSLSSYALSSDVSGCISAVSANSASWAASGGDVYISGFGYNDTAISSIEGSALYDKSAHARITTVAGRVTNLSSDVSGTVDLVSTQSANWGGSALALSAGLGVKLDMVGNTLVASTDETVLWTGSSNTGSMNLLESKNHFQKLNFHLDDVTGYNSVYTMDASASYATFNDVMPYPGVTNALLLKYLSVSAASDTSFTPIMRGRTIMSASYVDVATNSTNSLYCTKIVGINRTAGV